MTVPPQIVSDEPVLWKPLPKQRIALECFARELLYGGEKGGGKTEFLVACWIPLLEMAHQRFVATGQLQHKCRIIVFRKNLEHLKDFIAKSQYIYPQLDRTMGIRGWHINDKTWTFTSGATLACRHLDGPNDHLGYHGQELVGVGFDQLEQIEKDVYTFIFANLRSSIPEYHDARIARATANPGGYDWIIPHFHIDECPAGGQIFRADTVNADGSEHSSTRAFIRARLRDNPHLPPDYEAQLRSVYNADEVAMYLEGDFFRIAGSYFSKFLRPQLHFARWNPSKYPLLSTWEWRHAMDWGSTNPASWHIGCVDPSNGCLYVVDELYGPGVTGRKFGEALHEKFKRQQWCTDGKTFANDEIWGVIDKQAMDKYGGESTAAAGIKEWGFRLFEAKKDRVAGCNQMKERFLPDRLGHAQVVIFEDRCPALVKALSAIPSDAPRNPEEYKEDSQHAHACDSFRFLTMELPLRAVREANKMDVEVERWQSLLRRQRELSEGDRTMTTGYD